MKGWILFSTSWEKVAFREEVSALIRQIGDLERLVSKVAVNRINPREVVQLKRALRAIDPLKSLCSNSGCPAPCSAC